MTKHIQIETRSEPVNPPADLAAATQAVEELRSASEQFRTQQQADLRGVTDRLAALETRMSRPNIAGNTTQETTDEQRAFAAYIRRGDGGMNDVERRALTVSTDATAGYLAPTTFGEEVLKALREYSPLRQFARVITIGGRDVRYPRRTASTVATWVDEIANRTESAPAYEQVTLTPHECATFVEVSRQLLEDNAYNLEAELAADLGESFAIAEGSAFVAGDGIGKPKGILSATGIAEVLSGAAATMGTAPGDTLINVFSALPTYHAQNGAWCMNRNTLATVRKIKDSNGAYVWQPGLQAGQPSTLLGRPVIEAVDMPNIGAGAFPIIFGDWSGYRIVDRVDMSILSDPYSRAKNGLNVFHARKRVGGDVTNPDRFVKLKIATA